MNLALALLGAYLLGTIAWAQLLVRWFARRDLSRSGSSNVGALNAMRVSKSRGLGVAVLVLDALKGVAAVFLSQWLAVHPSIGLVGVVAGHNYNVWLSLAGRRLAGGKGFAAAAGALLCCLPWLVVVWFGVLLASWGGVKAWRGVTDEAPASAVATLALPPAAWWLYDGAAGLALAGVAVLILPKLVGEVRELLFARS